MKAQIADAAALRRAFDRSFAAPRATVRQAAESLLAIQIGGEPYAVHVSALAGLHADRCVVPAPSPSPDLLGLVGLRGTIAPVYDLRRLLGQPAGPAPRWLFLLRAGREDLVGFAFDRLDTHFQAAAADIVAATDSGARHVAGVVRTAEGALPLLDTVSLVAAITRGSDLHSKEI